MEGQANQASGLIASLCGSFVGDFCSSHPRHLQIQMNKQSLGAVGLDLNTLSTATFVCKRTFSKDHRSWLVSVCLDYNPICLI